MYNKYFLLRHGETIYQTEKKAFLYPWPDFVTKLTKNGEKKVETVAKKLKGKKIDLIYSSDFLRACQTAEIIVKEFGLKVIFDRRLREINFGIFQGGKTDDYKKFFLDRRQKFFKRPPKGENWRDVKKRMMDFIKDIEKKYKNKTILIISHGDPLWLLAGVIKGLKEEELLKIGEKVFYLDVGQFLKL